MTALYHSPSGIATARRCQHLWALERLDGLRELNVPWSEVTRDTPSRVRSASLGVAVHAKLEAYVKRDRLDWSDFPGQVAHSAVPYIPALKEITHAETEGSIGRAPMPASAPEHAPATRLRWEGVWWAGNRDLYVRANRAEFERLGMALAARKGCALYDYKSTSDIAKWSKDARELEGDLQANLYALDVISNEGEDVLAGRWLYIETRAVRRAYPVDVQLTYSRAIDVVSEACALARELDKIERSQDAPKNPHACGDYGGCPQHKTNGGPCNARVVPWSIVTNAHRDRRSLPMSSLAERRAQAEKEAATDESAPPAPKTRAPRAPKASAPDTNASKDAPRVTIKYGNVELVGPHDEVFALASKLAS